MKICLAAAVAVSLTGVLAPSAVGATLISDRPCYREGARASFLGSGFPAGQPVAVSLDGQQIGTQSADALGRVAGAIPSLTPIPTSERARTLTMAEVANPLNATSIVFKETRVAVVAKLNGVVPGGRAAFRARGFYGADDAPRTLYAHVRGPRRRNVRIGRVEGPCGKVSLAKVAITRRGDPLGLYRLQFDTVSRYIGSRAAVRKSGTFKISPISASSSASPLSSPVLGGRDSWEA